MNSTSSTTENITDTMANVTLTEPQRHKVYIVKYNFKSSPPEGDWAIFVKTNEHTGDIHFIASKDAGTRFCHAIKIIGAHELKKIGEGLVLIGTTLTQNYPGCWDKALPVVKENLQLATNSLALPGTTIVQNCPGGRDEAPRVVEENQQLATTSLALVGSTQAGKSPWEVSRLTSRWTQEIARPALERAGLLEKMNSKEFEKEAYCLRICISAEDEK